MYPITFELLVFLVCQVFFPPLKGSDVMKHGCPWFKRNMQLVLQVWLPEQIKMCLISIICDIFLDSLLHL